MGNQEDGWMVWQRRRNKKQNPNRTMIVHAKLDESPENTLVKYNEQEFARKIAKDSSVRSMTIPSRDRVEKITRHGDFHLMEKCFIEVSRVVSDIILKHSSCSTGTLTENLRYEVNFLALGIGDFYSNSSSFPQLAFFHYLSRNLSQAVNCMLLGKSNSVLLDRAGSMEIYDPVYDASHKKSFENLDIFLRGDHHYFIDGNILKEKKAGSTCRDRAVPVYVIFAPHAPIELPSLLILEIQNLVETNPLLSGAIQFFIGNSILPYTIGGEGELKVSSIERDISFKWPDAIGAFSDMKITPTWVEEKYTHSSRVSNARCLFTTDADVIATCQKVVKKSMRSKTSEMR